MMSSTKLDDTITIVSVTDNDYIILLAALIKSIELNHFDHHHIDFYIVGDRLSNYNIEKLHKSITCEKLTIHWLDMKEVIPERFNVPLDRSTFPLNIYLRLFIPYFLPKNIEKVIYLDVDMIVLEDISLLWDIDFGDNIIAAAKDPINLVSNSWGGIKNYKELGINENAEYFNSGLLVIDRFKWEQFEVTEKVIACIETNKTYATYPDQYGLNVVLYKKWFALDPRWNCFANQSNENPNIIHFTHRKPIYKSYFNNTSYKMLFYEYLSHTQWKGTKPIGEIKRYSKKFRNLLEKKIRIIKKSTQDKYD